ncbi:hypothetical protein [Gloeocapsopsis sp. IPPAS B-1203]|uniref:hypothetical protein n=1 Tax=Gloeocapsopsis sp. IPPAS B-1203 TaxID=2049454 RepID=UPI000C19D8A4|nr:hypothetical protein [Gloeocapsopsis sp. IPPAS B-1203]PIG95379.1 hypothetical protein CSQ79_02710 [Gloeocapsopsis sp. IPPAS B-1203]
MTQVTSEDIAKFREHLQDYPDASAALAEIEDCEGNLEDAAVVLAIRVGQQPDIANAEWLDSLAKKCRAIICREDNRSALLNADYASVIRYLATTRLCPPLLAVPVLMYVLQQGIDQFCQPLDTVST